MGIHPLVRGAFLLLLSFLTLFFVGETLAYRGGLQLALLHEVEGPLAVTRHCQQPTRQWGITLACDGPFWNGTSVSVLIIPKIGNAPLPNARWFDCEGGRWSTTDIYKKRAFRK